MLLLGIAARDYPVLVLNNAQWLELGWRGTVWQLLLAGVAGAVAWYVQRAAHPVHVLRTANLDERIAAGLLVDDPYLEDAPQRLRDSLPGLTPDDYRGPLRRAARFLGIYTHSSGADAARRWNEQRFSTYLAAALSIALVGIWFLSPLHATLALLPTLIAACGEVAGFLRLRGFLVDSWSNNEAALGGSPKALADLTRQGSLGVALIEVESDLRAAVYPALGTFGDGLLSAFCLIPISLLLRFGLFHWTLLCPLLAWPIGFFWLRSYRAAFRRAVRQQLEASGLAERIVSEGSQAERINAACHPLARFLLYRHLPQLGTASPSLRKELFIAASHAQWLLRPRPRYVSHMAGLLFRVAISSGLVALAFHVLDHPAVQSSWGEFARPLGWLVMVSPIILLAAVLTLWVCVYSSIDGGRARIAAEEFMRYLHQRVSG